MTLNSLDQTAFSLKGAPAPKPANISNDLLAVRGLCNTLNDPNLTGAETTPQEREQLAATLSASTVGATRGAITPMTTPAPQSINPIQPEQIPAPEPDKPRITKFFFTGRNGSDVEGLVQGLGFDAVSVDSVVRDWVTRFMGDLEVPADILAQLRACGDGLVTQAVPWSLQRVLLVKMVGDPNFGKPGFWVREALRAVVPGGVTILTGIRSAAEFKFLQAEGFGHYHVMCSNAAAQRRAGTGPQDNLAQHLDNDVIKKVSTRRQGPRLNVVWNDPAPLGSERFATVSQLAQEIAVCVSRDYPAAAAEDLGGVEII